MPRNRAQTRDGEKLPRYAEIARDIERAILSGTWPPGHRVPPESDLTRRYGCARMTVSKALSSLVDAGLIERRRRIGTIVAKPGSRPAAIEVRDIKTEIVARGATYGYRLLDRRRTRAGATEARHFGVAVGTPLLFVRALHFSDGAPFAAEDRRINLVEVPEAARQDFKEISAGAWLIEHVPWTDAEHRIGAASAGPNEAGLLGLKPGAPCLEIVRRTWRRDIPITAAHFVFPAEKHHLVARFTPRRNG